MMAHLKSDTNESNVYNLVRRYTFWLQSIGKMKDEVKLELAQTATSSELSLLLNSMPSIYPIEKPDNIWKIQTTASKNSNLLLKDFKDFKWDTRYIIYSDAEHFGMLLQRAQSISAYVGNQVFLYTMDKFDIFVLCIICLQDLAEVQRNSRRILSESSLSKLDMSRKEIGNTFELLISKEGGNCREVLTMLENYDRDEDHIIQDLASDILDKNPDLPWNIDLAKRSENIWGIRRIRSPLLEMAENITLGYDETRWVSTGLLDLHYSEPNEVLQSLAMNPSLYLDTELENYLSTRKEVKVRVSVAENDNVQNKRLTKLSKDKSPIVRAAVTTNKNTSQETMKRLAKDKDKNVQNVQNSALRELLKD
jgi:hypothetical protein